MAYFWDQFPDTNFHEINLDWILKTINKVYTETSEFLETYTGKIDDLEAFQKKMSARLDQIEYYINQINGGELPESVKNALRKWAAENIKSIIGKAIKQVFFGLENGYFVAYIPESWKGIVFGTITEYDSEFYGHLTLSMHYVNSEDNNYGRCI